MHGAANLGATGSGMLVRPTPNMAGDRNDKTKGCDEHK